MEEIGNYVAIHQLQKKITYLEDIIRMYLAVREGMGDAFEDVENASLEELHIAYAKKLWSEIQDEEET